jgi:hypothetical protein
MVAYTVSTRIVGQDLASEAFRKVSAAAKAAFRPIDAFKAAVQSPEHHKIGRIGVAFDNVAAKARGGLSSLTGWLPALGAIGSALTVGGLIEMTRHAAEGFEGLSLAAQKLGMSTGDLSVYRFAAKLAGVESEQLEKGLLKLNRAMYDAATGKNKDVAALFARMKIPLRDGAGAVKNAGTSLEDIADAFKHTGNESTRVAMAMALFGRSGADLLPFLMKGKEGISELRAEMKKYSGLSDQNREDLGHLAESYKRLDKAGSGLSSKLSAVFAPTLGRIVDRTTDWIVANRDLIAQNLERKLDALGRVAQSVGDGFDKIAQTPFGRWLGENVKSSDLLNAGMIVLGATMIGPVVTGLSMATGAVLRMNAAVLANPFILSAALIGATALEIVRHWDEVTAAFSNAWEKAGILGVAFEAINVPVNALFMAINDLSKALFGLDLEKIGADVEKYLTAKFEKLIGYLKDAFDWLKKLGGVSWSGVKEFAGKVASAGMDTSGLESAIAAAGPPGPVAPQPPSPDSAIAARAAPAQAEVQVKVDFGNVPQGTSTDVKTSGTAKVDTAVGRSMHDSYGA